MGCMRGAQVLDIRAKHSDFEQALRDKEQLRLERLEARTFSMAEQRVDQQIKHVERYALPLCSALGTLPRTVSQVLVA